MIVCIAEKPSVGRDIASVLGATRSYPGFMEGAGYRVTWTFGHLCELKEPHEYTPLWKRWSLGALPMIPNHYGIRLKKTPGIKKQFALIAQLVSEAEYVVNCGDAGQEGELIQRWVMQLAKTRCPVKRLWINSLTPEAIREGFRHLRPQSDFDALYFAGLCRAIGDWTLGINATRLFTVRYGGRNLLRYGSSRVMSVGRVQTPTLALLVKRQEEIDNFVPAPYWALATVYRSRLFTAVMGEGQRGFKTEAEAMSALEAVSHAPFTVTKVEKKKASEAPPRLFDLTSLQVECNRRFGFTAERTLQTIQSLYEKKFTTYPRVDTTCLPDDVYLKCRGILAGLTQYHDQMKAIRGKALLRRSAVFNQKKVTDHHAIIPTGMQLQGITDDEARVYDLVCLRFIGVFFPDCTFETTTVTGQAGGTAFRTSGKHITDPGWRALWAKDNSDKPAEKTLPLFIKGESGEHSPSVEQKHTTPPKRYTEGALLRAMETAGNLTDDEELREALKENGIGRPSTRASIIETLFSRGYIIRDGKSIVPTAMGRDLISLIDVDLLKSVELTGLWESKLRAVERREYDPKQFLDEMKVMVAEVVVRVLTASDKHAPSR